MPAHLLSRTPRRFYLLALTSPALLHAQLIAPDPAGAAVQLDRIVIAATRSPQEIRTIPSSVISVPLADLAQEQIGDLRLALTQEAGVFVLNTGAFGSTSSVSIRGGNSYQTLLVVDGVRMNDRSADYGNFLGGTDLANVAHLEVLRGPQSTLYGSSAMGGVILIDSIEGQGTPTGAVAVTAGSFETWSASAAASGSVNSLSYSGSVSRFATANDRDYNGLREWSLATRVAYRINANVEIGATFRDLDGRYEEPGATSFVSPGAVNAQNELTTIFATVKAGDDFISKLTLGLHHRLYDFSSSYGESPLRNVREILDWQNTWEISPQLELVGGTNFEESRYTVDGARSTDKLGAGYLSATAHPLKQVTLTAGLRYDDYKSVGGATTYRLGAAWNPTVATKLHATFGTGFSAPGSDDRYGVPSFGQLPDPTIQPEKSNGWDVGISESFDGGRANVDVTYFKNQYRNLFEWQYVDYTTFTGETVNIARATTSGVEVTADTQLTRAWKFHGTYTYLEATDDTLHQRLGRRPRHVADADLILTVTSVWDFGGGIHWVSDQVDGVGELADYTTVRFFTSYTVRKNWLLKLRLENAFNRHYEEVRGYPALPFGAFGSIEWKF